VTPGFEVTGSCAIFDLAAVVYSHQLAVDYTKVREDATATDQKLRRSHGSYKVFYLQDAVKEAFALIEEIGGESDPPHFEYTRIVEAGTAHNFQGERTNTNWDAETKPILEAFWHNKYFINMMVKYATELETVEMPLDYGMAAVLYLYELR
jgi:hypothetical protein